MAPTRSLVVAAVLAAGLALASCGQSQPVNGVCVNAQGQRVGDAMCPEDPYGVGPYGTSWVIAEDDIDVVYPYGHRVTDDRRYHRPDPAKRSKVVLYKAESPRAGQTTVAKVGSPPSSKSGWFSSPGSSSKSSSSYSSSSSSSRSSSLSSSSSSSSSSKSGK